MFDKELTNEEYEKLSDSYVANPPKLSGKPGHITIIMVLNVFQYLVHMPEAKPHRTATLTFI